MFFYIGRGVLFLCLLFLRGRGGQRAYKERLFRLCKSRLYVFIFSCCFSLNFLGGLRIFIGLTVFPVFVFSVRVRLWGMGQIKKLFLGKRYIGHFIPQGAPQTFLIFLFLVESIRSLVQPLTLTVRLCANLITGHVLFFLVLSSSFFICRVGIIILESLVIIVQAFVFSLLIFLYGS